MKTAYATAIALVASLAAAPAMAEHPNAISVDHLIKAEGVAKTRAQVVAELQQAQANRDQRPSDQFGLTVSEAYPAGVPTAKIADGKTRAQVMAEVAAAQRASADRPSDQFGRTVAEVSPGFDVQAERVRAATAPADNARKGVL